MRIASVLGIVWLGLSVGACADGEGRPEVDGALLPPLVTALGPGRVVAVGGALSSENAPIYMAVLDARMGTGPICILPTASGVPESSGENAVAAFELHGGESAVIVIPISTETPEMVMDEGVATLLSGCSAFWFVGGQQSRIAQVFNPDGTGSPALRAIIGRIEEGAVVSGSSAGAAILSDPMINGGSSDGALARGVGSESGAGVVLTRGGGFSDGVLLDQHFLARGRFARLVVALLDSTTPGIGVGIDENTAFVFEGQIGTVIGASQAILVDVRTAIVTRSETGGISVASGIRIELLSPGDEVDLSSLEVTRTLQSPSAPASAVPTAPEDPFDGRALQLYLSGLALTPTEVLQGAFVTPDGFTLTFEKDVGFEQGLGGHGGLCLDRDDRNGCWRDGGSRGVEWLPLATGGPFLLTIRGPGAAG